VTPLVRSAGCGGLIATPRAITADSEAINLPPPLWKEKGLINTTRENVARTACSSFGKPQMNVERADTTK